MTRRQGDQGFTLIELLLVIVVLAVLGTIVVSSVRGVSAETQETSCRTDRRTLYTAGEAYFAQLAADSIASIGATPDRFELALVSEGFLREPSVFYDLDANGDVHPATGSPCTS